MICAGYHTMVWFIWSEHCTSITTHVVPRNHFNCLKKSHRYYIRSDVSCSNQQSRNSVLSFAKGLKSRLIRPRMYVDLEFMWIPRYLTGCLNIYYFLLCIVFVLFVLFSSQPLLFWMTSYCVQTYSTQWHYITRHVVVHRRQFFKIFILKQVIQNFKKVV